MISRAPLTRTALVAASALLFVAPATPVLAQGKSVARSVSVYVPAEEVGERAEGES